MSRIPVYFVPGLAATPAIFSRIRLPEDRFEMHFMEWIMPEKGERLSEYAMRMAAQIKHENPVLVGVSFGGIVVQELKTIVNARKTIIISSVKCNAEFPFRMKFALYTGLYKLAPTKMFEDLSRLRRLPLGKALARRFKMYEKYMGVRQHSYIDWALDAILRWERCEADADVIHIHGDRDEVFPASNLKRYISVKGGTHVMILNKSRFINEWLPKIIDGELPSMERVS